VQATAEKTMLATLESAKADIGESSRQLLEAARADLHESVRIAAEAAAKPVADAAARAVIEQVARDTLAAALAEEAASLGRVEQATIAVAERVGRELVQAAFAAAQVKPGTAGGEPGATSVGGAAVDAERMADVPAIATAPAEPPPTARSLPAAVLPWLGAVTLAVLYLLAKAYF